MVQQGLGGYLVFEEPHLVTLKRTGKDYMDLDAIYAEDVAGRADVMRSRWEASGITAGADDQVDTYANLFEALPWLSLATTARDIRRAKETGTHARLEYDQPMEGLPRDISELEQAHANGRRIQDLTYNVSDFVGCGCTERVDHGLTHYGVEVVKKCNELGIVVDTAHTGRLSTLDACRVPRHPVTASHNGADALYKHDRNKSDDEIRAVADTGGLVGVFAVPFFLCNDLKADINYMLDHIDYIADLVGWEHVGIGTDWPVKGPKDDLESGFGPETQALYGFRPEHNIRVRQNLVGFDDARDFPNITRGLVARGNTDEQVAGILGENFLRVFEEVCG